MILDDTANNEYKTFKKPDANNKIKKTTICKLPK